MQGTGTILKGGTGHELHDQDILFHYYYKITPLIPIMMQYDYGVQEHA